MVILVNAHVTNVLHALRKGKTQLPKMGITIAHMGIYIMMHMILCWNDIYVCTMFTICTITSSEIHMKNILIYDDEYGYDFQNDIFIGGSNTSTIAYEDLKIWLEQSDIPLSCDADSDFIFIDQTLHENDKDFYDDSYFCIDIPVRNLLPLLSVKTAQRIALLHDVDVSV